MNPDQTRAQLAAIGQDHVLRYLNELDDAGRTRLLGQLAAVDSASLDQLVRTQVVVKAELALPKEIKPVEQYPRTADAALRTQYAAAEARGAELLSRGQVAAFLVAGGQGTRLGYDGPKGEYPVSPIKNKPLFQVFAEGLLAHGRNAGRPIPWYVMTSDANDAATRAFFQRHNHFGLDPRDVVFFTQGMMPAFAMDGKLLLAEKSSLALSPDGHGGSLRALKRSGALDDMAKRGICHLSYFQVDNPLVQVIDPLFLGLHDLTGSEMSSKAIPKAGPLEKVGNFVIGDGRLQVIEYSDLPDELARAVNADGSLKINGGSIGIHALRVEFIESLNAGGDLRLPWHRAEKKVAYIDDAGRAAKPQTPNAVKLEQFVFDAIPLAKNAIVYTTDRAEEFSPVKNAEGSDSPQTSRRDQVRRSLRWLAEAGVKVPADSGDGPSLVLEISPLVATSAKSLAAKLSSIKLPTLKAGDRIYIGPDGVETA